MTTSNRFVNRLVLFVVGLVLAAVSVGAVLIAVAQPVRDSMLSFADGQGADLVSRLSPEQGTAWSDAAVLWPLYAIVGICLLGIVLALVMAFAHGRGRTTTVLREEAEDGPAGGIEIATGFAEDVLENALAGRTELLDVTVAAYRHGSDTALKVRVLPRAGVSPRTVVDAVHHEVIALDTLLGARLPVLLEIASSARAGFSKEDRVA
ncbi:hypothetical protein [Rathayibacter tritici]|uniref:Alkaline shock response membrane anchor protein AmaP n=1 Tax=Rathayibacter tritici TaxID=33888 RepID=A0A160KR17_9MICO|nr:hypothetical protein [Rathayibacter tritici]AND15679.1 hypothetical protein A6122_0521 [Rathayibacter tritici]PPF23689.1 hypothetical protein C5C06_13910 [Rathayibacter tritici]PPI16809.1 hypothetical protein C5D07_06090 [Rathayibacter tritici]PPI45652.1 hypothetical protein C5D18_06305 [Rathayibacter tritici]